MNGQKDLTEHVGELIVLANDKLKDYLQSVSVTDQNVTTVSLLIQNLFKTYKDVSDGVKVNVQNNNNTKTPKIDKLLADRRLTLSEFDEEDDTTQQ